MGCPTGKQRPTNPLIQAQISTAAGFRGKRLLRAKPAESFTRLVETKTTAVQRVWWLLRCFPTLYGYGLGFWF